MAKILGLLLVFVSIVSALKAQSGIDHLINDTFDEGVTNIYQSYARKQGKASQIFNGPEYIPADINIKGHAFFERNSLQSGVIKYDGVVYVNIEMGFDIYRNELAIVYYDEHGNFSLIKLSNPKIDGFRFDGHA